MRRNAAFDLKPLASPCSFIASLPNRRRPRGNRPVIAINPAFSRLGDENAFAVLARAAELARQGRDIINLGIGQPDFKTAAHIVEAAVKALRDGEHGYTPATGIRRCARRSPADLHRRLGVEVSPDDRR